jgi:predicted component of type VI protein secretion system
MSAEPTAQDGGRGSTSARLLPADGLARDLAMAHASARAAGYLLTRDPSAAGRALRDLTRHTRAALDARTGTRPQEARTRRASSCPNC